MLFLITYFELAEIIIYFILQINCIFIEKLNCTPQKRKIIN